MYRELAQISLKAMINRSTFIENKTLYKAALTRVVKDSNGHWGSKVRTPFDLLCSQLVRDGQTDRQPPSFFLKVRERINRVFFIDRLKRK